MRAVNFLVAAHRRAGVDTSIGPRTWSRIRSNVSRFRCVARMDTSEAYLPGNPRQMLWGRRVGPGRWVGQLRRAAGHTLLGNTHS